MQPDSAVARPDILIDDRDAAKQHMTQFGRFLLGSLTLGALAVSMRWTILPLTPSTSDYFVVSLALGALYVLLALGLLWMAGMNSAP